MNDMLKIVNLNAYIQRGLGKLFIDNKEVLCVSLDRTCTFKVRDDNINLTDVQLDDLVLQTTKRR